MTVQVDWYLLYVFTGATSERPDRIGGTSPPRICVKRCFSLYFASAKSPHDGGALGRRGGMADAIDLGSIALTGVEVRVLSSAPWAVGARGLAGRRLLCKEKIVGSNPTGSTSRVICEYSFGPSS